MHLSPTSKLGYLSFKLYYNGWRESCYDWCTSPAAESEPPQIFC